MLLKVKTSKTGAIKQVFEKMHAYIPDCNLIFVDSDNKKKFSGLMIQQLSEEKHIFVQLVLIAKNFDKFACAKSVIKIVVNVQQLWGMLKLIPDEQTLMIYLKQSNENLLYIRGIAKNDNEDRIRLELNLITSPIVELPAPKMDGMSSFVMERKKFYSICKEFNDNVDKVTITKTGNQLNIMGICPGGKIDKTYKIDCNDDDDSVIQGEYELKSLVSFSSCNKLCSNVTIRLKDKDPLVLDMNVDDLGKLYIYLSPCEENVIN
jgi:hypothetical protein